MNKKYKYPPIRYQQNGAALIFAIIITAAVSILAATMLNDLRLLNSLAYKQLQKTDDRIFTQYVKAKFNCIYNVYNEDAPTSGAYQGLACTPGSYTKLYGYNGTNFTNHLYYAHNSRYGKTIVNLPYTSYPNFQRDVRAYCISPTQYRLEVRKSGTGVWRITDTIDCSWTI